MWGVRRALACALVAIATAVSVVGAASDADVVTQFQTLESILPNVAAGEQRFPRGPSEDRSDRHAFDFIVVGAGAGGCVVANRLSEISHWQVLLLEAGGDETHAMGVPFMAAQGPAIDWNYTLAPQPNGGCPLGPDGQCPSPRGFVMGGSTVLNGMVFTRGNRRDYDNWAALGNVGWDYESVLPYFKKMENVQIPELRDSPYHGTSGNLMNSRPNETIFANYTIEAAKALGIPEVDHNGAVQSGVSRMQSTTYKGSRWSANRGYIQGLNRRNLIVRKRSLVSKVIIQRGRAMGVEYIRDGKKYQAFAKKEVILSAGSFNSPKILMLSGVGPKDHLRELGIPLVKDLPVGRTLYDHTVFISLLIQLNTPITPTRYQTLMNMENWAQYYADQTGPLSRLWIAEMLGFFEVGSKATDSSWPNYELMASAQTTIVGPLYANSLGIPDDFYQQFIVPIINKPVIQPYFLSLRPKSSGTLTLRDKNVYSKPIINPNFFAEEEDVLNTVEAIKYGIRMYTSGPFARLGAKVYNTPIPRCKHLAFGTDKYWSCAVRWGSTNIYHPIGTNKMGPREDNMAVVSPKLKVWGLKRLRIVDASVMPVMPAAHTQVPTYMIAERGSDLIKCELLGQSYCQFVEP